MSEKAAPSLPNIQSSRLDKTKLDGSSATTVPKPKKLLDQVSEALRTKHYAYRTEQTYVDWIKRYIIFHEKRHPHHPRITRPQGYKDYHDLHPRITTW